MPCLCVCACISVGVVCLSVCEGIHCLPTLLCQVRHNFSGWTQDKTERKQKKWTDVVSFLVKTAHNVSLTSHSWNEADVCLFCTKLNYMCCSGRELEWLINNKMLRTPLPGVWFMVPCIMQVRFWCILVSLNSWKLCNQQVNMHWLCSFVWNLLNRKKLFRSLHPTF